MAYCRVAQVTSRSGRRQALLVLPKSIYGPMTSPFFNTPAARPEFLKAAMLTHGNVVANVLQARAWVSPVFAGEPATLLTPLPLYHIFALTANCLLFLSLGWRNILIVNPRDLPAVIGEMKKYPFSFFSGVNTLFNALLNAPAFAGVNFSQLKVTLGGGMAVAGLCRRTVAAGNRQSDYPGLGPHRNLPRWLHQSRGKNHLTDRLACLYLQLKSRSRTIAAAICPSIRLVKYACEARK